MKFNKYTILTVYIVFIAFAVIQTFRFHYAAAADERQVIRITAKKFEFSPKDITVKKGIPVILELESLDRLHGFSCPALGIRADINPDTLTKVTFIADKAGTFPFHCDVFCGSGHEEMEGTITVEE